MATVIRFDDVDEWAGVDRRSEDAAEKYYRQRYEMKRRRENHTGPVRMILYDYDAADDGVGTYTKLDHIFPSIREAISHKANKMHDMYWGELQNMGGEIIARLEEKSWGEPEYPEY